MEARTGRTARENEIGIGNTGITGDAIVPGTAQETRGQLSGGLKLTRMRGIGVIPRAGTGLGHLLRDRPRARPGAVLHQPHTRDPITETTREDTAEATARTGQARGALSTTESRTTRSKAITHTRATPYTRTNKAGQYPMVSEDIN